MNSKIIAFTLLAFTKSVGANEMITIPSENACALRMVTRCILDDQNLQEGSLEGLIDAEVKEGDNLKLEYKQMNAFTLFFAKMGFFFVELYAKSMARIKKIWHTYKTA